MQGYSSARTTPQNRMYLILTGQVVFGCFRPIIFTVFGELTKALSGKNCVPMQDFLLITMGNPTLVPGSFLGNGVFLLACFDGFEMEFY